MSSARWEAASPHTMAEKPKRRYRDLLEHGIVTKTEGPEYEDTDHEENHGNGQAEKPSGQLSLF